MSAVQTALHDALRHSQQRHFHSAVGCLEQCRSGLRKQRDQEPSSESAINKDILLIEARLKPLIDKMRSDPYLALKLNRDCTLSQVKKSYRILALQFHPDKNHGTLELFQLIQGAFETLRTSPAVLSRIKQKHNKRHGHTHHGGDREGGRNTPRTPPAAANAPEASYETRGRRSDEEGKFDEARQRARAVSEARERARADLHKAAKASRARKERRRSESENNENNSYATKANISKGRTSAHYRASSESTSASSDVGSNGTYSRKKDVPQVPDPDANDGADNTTEQETKKEQDAKEADAKLRQFWQSVQQSESWSKLKHAAVQQAQKEADLARRRAQTIHKPTVNSASNTTYPQPEIYAGASIPIRPTINSTTTHPKRQAHQAQQAQQHTASREAAAQEKAQQQRYAADGVAAADTTYTNRESLIEPLPVRGLRMRSRTGRSVTLEWGPPQNAHEPGRISGDCVVVGYEIQMREGIFPWLTAGTGIKGFACKKNNLEPGREYGFRVRACGQGDIWGSFCKSCVASTAPEVPCAPGPPDAMSDADISTAALITWDQPLENGSPVEAYALELRECDRMKGIQEWNKASETIRSTACRKRNLIHGLVYQFRVRARNRMGWGGWSAVSRPLHVVVLNSNPDVVVESAIGKENLETPILSTEIVDDSYRINMDEMSGDCESEVHVVQQEEEKYVYVNIGTAHAKAVDVETPSLGFWGSHRQHGELVAEEEEEEEAEAEDEEEEATEKEKEEQQQQQQQQQQAGEFELQTTVDIDVERDHISVPEDPVNREQNLSTHDFPSHETNMDAGVVETTVDLGETTAFHVEHYVESKNDFDLWEEEDQNFVPTIPHHILPYPEDSRSSPTVQYPEQEEWSYSISPLDAQQETQRATKSENILEADLGLKVGSLDIGESPKPENAKPKSESNFVVIKDELPEGWTSVPSRSRPGECSYENKYTNERQIIRPTAPAKRTKTGRSSGGEGKASPKRQQQQQQQQQQPRERKEKNSGQFDATRTVDGESLPDGWTRVKSRSRAGQFSYENTLTGERQVLLPLAPASSIPVSVSNVEKKMQPVMAKVKDRASSGAVLNSQSHDTKATEASCENEKTTVEPNKEVTQTETLLTQKFSEKRTKSSDSGSWFWGQDEVNTKAVEAGGLPNPSDTAPDGTNFNREEGPGSYDSYAYENKYDDGMSGGSSSDESSSDEDEDEGFAGREVWLELRHGGNLYYYNTSSGASVWKRPTSAAGIPIIPEAVIQPPPPSSVDHSSSSSSISDTPVVDIDGGTSCEENDEKGSRVGSAHAEHTDDTNLAVDSDFVPPGRVPIIIS